MRNNMSSSSSSSSSSSLFFFLLLLLILLFVDFSNGQQRINPERRIGGMEEGIHEGLEEEEGKEEGRVERKQIENGFMGNGSSTTGEVVFSWENGFIDFVFPDTVSHLFYSLNSSIWRECIPNGFKLSINGTMFVSLRRGGICPVTLAKVSSSSPSSTSPLLEPYPSWLFNGGVQNSSFLTPWRSDPLNMLQSVLGFEIDPCNRMWILDQGMSSFNLPSAPGYSKLLIWDISSNSLIQKHSFPSGVVFYNTSFLDDLVVDLVHSFAYITDAGVPWTPSGGQSTINFYTNQTRGGLIIYSFEENTSWRVLDSHPSVQPQLNFWLQVNGENVSHSRPLQVGVDGIALSTDTSVLYYTSLTGTLLWAIPTSALRNRSLSSAEISSMVQLVGDMTSAAGGIVYGSDDRLYATDLTDNGIKMLGIQPSFLGIEVQWVYKDQSLQWPDGLGFDLKGNMWAISNQLQRAINSENITVVALWKFPVGCVSYMENWEPLCSSSSSSSSPTPTPTPGSGSDSGSGSSSSSATSSEKTKELYFDLMLAFGFLAVVFLVTTLGFAILWRRDSGRNLLYTPLDA